MDLEKEESPKLEIIKYNDQLNGKSLNDTIVSFNSGVSFTFKKEVNSDESDESVDSQPTTKNNGLLDFLNNINKMEEVAIPLVSSQQITFDKDPSMSTILIKDFMGNHHSFSSEAIASELDFAIPKLGTDWDEMKQIFKACFDLSVATIAKSGKVKFVLTNLTNSKTVPSKIWMYSAFEDLESYFTNDEYLNMLSNISNVEGDKLVEVLNNQEIKPIDIDLEKNIDFTKVLKDTKAEGSERLSMPNLRPHFVALEKWGEENDVKFKITNHNGDFIEFTEDTDKKPDPEDFINTWTINWSNSSILPTYTISHQITRFVCSNGMITGVKQLKNILSDDFLKENTKRTLLPYLTKAIKVKTITKSSILNLQKQKPLDLAKIAKEYKNMFKVLGVLKLDDENIKDTFKNVSESCVKIPYEIKSALLEQILLTSKNLLEDHEKIENLYDCLNLVTFLMQSREMSWSRYQLAYVTSAFTKLVVGDFDEEYQDMVNVLGLVEDSIDLV